MAASIHSAFQGLKANLEITGLQQSTVSTRQQRVRDAVARRLRVLDSFVTGSYKRHTMIAPLKEADVDVFIVLSAEHYRTGGHASLLDRVKQVLLETYSKTPRISRNGQAVTITFSDFVVDVVPGFNRQGGGYLIPSAPEARWIATNPKAHETFMSAANASHGGDLVPLIKAIKAWNRGIGGVLRSFYLELLVEEILRGVRITDFSSGCRYVFEKGREAVRYKVHDPSGINPYQVSGLAAGRVTDAVKRFETAYGWARRAEVYASRGRVPEAISEWRKVFRDYFPAYG